LHSFTAAARACGGQSVWPNVVATRDLGLAFPPHVPVPRAALRELLKDALHGAEAETQRELEWRLARLIAHRRVATGAQQEVRGVRAVLCHGRVERRALHKLDGEGDQVVARAEGLVHALRRVDRPHLALHNLVVRADPREGVLGARLVEQQREDARFALKRRGRDLCEAEAVPHGVCAAALMVFVSIIASSASVRMAVGSASSIGGCAEDAPRPEGPAARLPRLSQAEPS
jgi:hypothetical protein